MTAEILKFAPKEAPRERRASMEAAHRPAAALDAETLLSTTELLRCGYRTTHGYGYRRLPDDLIALFRPRPDGAA
jgi:hypothetical protein